MRYQAVIDVNNKNNSHTIAIDFVSEIAGDKKLNILDVGCSAGYLGEYFKTLGHHVTGIDINAEAIEVAREYLDEVYCESLDIFFAREFKNKFDVVLFGDVLEHVTNPEEILNKTANVLSTDGVVVASIPNVSHLAVRAMLLEGRWEYANLGLLDKDHFRFFTKENIYKLFSDSNFEVLDMKPVRLKVEEVNALCSMRLNPKYVKFAKMLAGNDDSSDIFQYVSVASPHQAGAKRVVAFVPDALSSLVDIRILGPLENWANRYSGAFRIRDFGNIRNEDLYWGDVFLFERISSPGIYELIETLKKFGKKVIFEMDDLLLELPIFLGHHRLSSSEAECLTKSMVSADALSTTTERLADKLRQYNPNVYVVPNCIREMMSPASVAVAGSVKATLVVASSDSVTVDMVLKPIQRIKEAYGDSVKVVAIGPIAQFFKEKKIPIEEHPIQGYAEFRSLLSQLEKPIGIIPLDDSVFSSCKSPIKFFDYASVGIPSLCSNVPPYSDFVVNEKTGLLVANNEQAWFEAISRVIEDSTLRASLLSNAREYVLNTHMMDKAGDAWQHLIDSLGVQRVEAFQLLRPDSIRPAFKERLKLFINQLFHLQIYKNATKVLFREGPKGIIWRLRRL
jgi:2-polyprenyl-3-methyl-5-hydroxy-6-metoxy-1,4-benzoquinol methylase